ncbi:MAG: response regulator [bacterium]
MNSDSGFVWRFLIIEDDPDIAHELEEACPRFVQPDKSITHVFTNFKEAAESVASGRYDIFIIDLKDDQRSLPGDEKLPGYEIYESIKKLLFVPVVFYTALPKKVLPEATTFVRVVEKGPGLKGLDNAIKEIIATGLPSLNRILYETQREYMWDFVQLHWKDFESVHEQEDLAYLLARRLSLTLENNARKLAQKITGEEVHVDDSSNAHPMQLYVFPPFAEKPAAGQILKGKVGNEDGYWVILTPTCDFHQKDRIERVLLAQCRLLKDQSEYIEWSKNQDKPNTDLLRELIGDRRNKAQWERFKYLPGTFFIPDLVVDFQLLKAISSDDLKPLEVVTCLDSPYAESLLSRFSRYFGRLGTTDIDKTVVIDRLKANLTKPVAAPPPPKTSEKKA